MKLNDTTTLPFDAPSQTVTVKPTPDECEDDFGHFVTHKGQHSPVRISLRWGKKRRSIRYPHTGDITFDGSATIVIETVDRLVTITGKGLESLVDYLEREKVCIIRVIDPSRLALGELPAYVDAIEVQDKPAE